MARTQPGVLVDDVRHGIRLRRIESAGEEDDEVDADDLSPTLVQNLWSLMGRKGKRRRSNESALESFDALLPLVE